MAGQPFKRKIIDLQGNIYCFMIPNDVDPDSLEDVLIAAQEGIVSLQAYCLVNDVYRFPHDNSVVPLGGKAFGLYKKTFLADVLVGNKIKHEDFGNVVKEMIERARRINKPKTQYDGKPVHQDQRGYYVEWQFNCQSCHDIIKGTRRLSMNAGEFSRMQGFVPDDPRVQSAKLGGKAKLCPKCAVTVIKPAEPVVEDIAVTQPVPQESIVMGGAIHTAVSGIQSVLATIKELSGPQSEVNPLWLKGFVNGSMIGLLAEGQ